MEKKRDLTLDIAKAICIILMVVGHSFLTHNYWHNFIYMFHMPCFFFISGWLLSDKYLADLKTGLMRKAKGSYWPFVKWSLIFLLFHNLLAQLHIYGASYSLREFVIKIVRIFTLTGSEQLLGGFWFLISLFWASVASLLFLWLLNRIGRLTNICISGGGDFCSSLRCWRKMASRSSATTIWIANYDGYGFLLDRLPVAQGWRDEPLWFIMDGVVVGDPGCSCHVHGFRHDDNHRFRNPAILCNFNVRYVRRAGLIEVDGASSHINCFQIRR